MKNDNNFSGQTIALNLKNLKLSINQILFRCLAVDANRSRLPATLPAGHFIIEGYIKNLTL
jgi:hypothetical protein